MALERDTPLVSVIVPVHNAGTYLAPLLDSLAQQRQPALEFLLVDDGSSDGSSQRLDEFARREPRARVVRHDTPRGAASARNSGIDAARGQWLAFADADDWVAPGMYESLLARAVEADLDVCYGNGFEFADDPSRPGRPVVRQPKPADVLDGRQWLVACWHGGERIACAWLSLVRRELVASRWLRWPDGYAIDDEIWTVRLLLAASRVGWLDRPLYGYRHHGGSLTRSEQPERLARRIDGFIRVAHDLFVLADGERGDVGRAIAAIACDNGNAALGSLRRLGPPARRADLFRSLRSSGLLARLGLGDKRLRLTKRLLREWLNLAYVRVVGS
jgi:glycosyltransferase involved in cell wall biosynthesis